MGEHVTLYSSHQITFEELSTAILGAGGEPIAPEERYGLDLLGRIEKGRQYILIYGDAESEAPGRFWEREVDYLGKEVMEEIEAKLRGKPVVSFMLKIGYGARSGLLAVELAYQCAKRWPCVVRAEVFEDADWKTKVYTKEDMERLLTQGEAFTIYGMLDDDEDEGE